MNNKPRLEATHFIEQYNTCTGGCHFGLFVSEISLLYEYLYKTSELDNLKTVAIFKIKYHEQH